MAHAYTPGLQLLEKILLSKRRALPLPGEVLVKVGDRVKADQIVARAELPNEVVSVNIANMLGISPSEVNEYMLKKIGEQVRKDETIAENRPFIKWFKRSIPSPTDGTIETISNVTGQVMVRKPPRHVNLMAYVDGTVTEVEENLGVEVETPASFIQGIFGIGGERCGELKIVVSDPGEELTLDMLDETLKDKIIVAGSFMNAETLKKALDLGVKGIIVGGINSRDLTAWLGYEIGVAITGDEPVSATFIITEGFGRIPMARRTFELLKANEAKQASISGRTQIRAGVMRPEVIVPLDLTKDQVPRQEDIEENVATGVLSGHQVRIIREPYFGRLGEVKNLPPELREIDTEAKVRVMEVVLDSGEEIVVPRANVEIIEAN